MQTHIYDTAGKQSVATLTVTELSLMRLTFETLNVAKTSGTLSVSAENVVTPS